MLRRVFTAVVGIPLVVLIIKCAGEKAFFLLVLIVVALALNEFFGMTLSEEDVSGRGLGIILGGFVLLAAFLGSQLSTGNSSRTWFLFSGTCVISIFAIFFYHIVFNSNITDACHRIAIKVFGIFYIAFLSAHIILLRAHPDGINLLLFLLFVTWTGDTGAYFFGSWKGRNALCQMISPNKTLEGALGSIFAGVCMAFVCRMFFLKNISLLHCLALGIGINFMNQFGDLSESILKRAFGKKDSGSILPGHGGVFDRIDSLLFAAPFIFYYIKVVMPEI